MGVKQDIIFTTLGIDVFKMLAAYKFIYSQEK